MKHRATVVRHLTTFFVGMGLLVGLVGCGGEVPEAVNDGENKSAPAGEMKRLIVLTNGNSPFWDAAAIGAKNAGKEFKLEEQGLTVVIDRNDFSVSGQIDKLKQYASSSDIAAIAISVTDSKSPAIPRELKALRDSGIKVVTIDSDVDRKNSRDARFAYLGTDNIVGGGELGRAASGLRPQGGKYVTFVGVKSAANAIERIGGFAKGAGETFESLESLGDGGDSDKARKNVRDALDRNPELNTLVGIWSYNTPAIVDNAKDLKIRDKVTVVGFDADPPAIRAMGEGFGDVMVVQNPYQMGYQGVRLLKAMLDDDQATIKEILPNQGAEDGDLHDTGLKVVVPDEGSPLKADMFESNTQFLKLSKFQAWLDQYGLTGS